MEKKLDDTLRRLRYYRVSVLGQLNCVAHSIGEGSPKFVVPVRDHDPMSAFSSELQLQSTIGGSFAASGIVKKSLESNVNESDRLSAPEKTALLTRVLTSAGLYFNRASRPEVTSEYATKLSSLNDVQGISRTWKVQGCDGRGTKSSRYVF